ncbi:hypothetical protein RMATCC62417_10927 [Rhizopus microsporus]|nr:hypothetical protein RMATCC62417_10927 [Rhizopus microsporus]
MRLFLLLCIIINIVYAVDYFDILKKEVYEKPSGKVRTFYMTAEEEIWDYAIHSLKNKVPVKNGLGTKYYKSLYYEYTDSTFTKKKKKPEWQGNMGPVLRAEVGDTIVVHFWNKATRPVTMHPHGVFYEFENEGAIFKDGYEKAAIEPNQKFTYTWTVSPRAGPGPTDENSVVWGYHSHISEGDIYAGLYGAIVVYRPDTLSDEEVVTCLFISDERQSAYFDKSVSTLYDKAKLKEDTGMHSTINGFHVINGLVNSSPIDLVFKKKKVVWHLIGWGTFWDTQYVKWENARVTLNGKRTHQVRLYPASFYTVTLQFKESGQWKFGYLDRESEGMIMHYNVSL